MAVLYGLGVGPGDPELVTLKAARLIRECEIIAVPASGQEVNAALTIAAGAVPELKEREVVEISMPMIRDRERLRESHDAAARQVIGFLKEGNDVAFLTLGDPSIYSTYIYIHKRVLEAGYEARLVPGIPSFCAAAARLNEGLTEASQALHVIPASYKGLEEAMELPGTKVLMKSGRSIGKIRDRIRENPRRWEAKMVERCGMKGERVFLSAEEIDPEASYFSIVIVKDK